MHAPLLLLHEQIIVTSVVVQWRYPHVHVLCMQGCMVIACEPLFPFLQPLTSSLTRPAPTFQHADAPAIQVQYLEGLIKDTAEELR